MVEAFGLDRRIEKYQGKRPIGYYSWKQANMSLQQTARAELQHKIESFCCLGCG